MSFDQQNNSQMVLPLSFDDKARFENFWSADNTELVQALQAGVGSSKPKMLYFYGATGSGKSHLMFALQRLAKEKTVSSLYLSLSDPRVTIDMLEMIDSKIIVCVDDVQVWAGCSDKERALFALFERIKHDGGQLFISATQPPEHCGFQLKDLVSRLASGLVYSVHSLNDEQRFDAVKLRASQRGLSISDEVVKYLLSRSSRDTSELFALLDRIDKASLIEKRRITIPFLQSLMS